MTEPKPCQICGDVPRPTQNEDGDFDLGCCGHYLMAYDSEEEIIADWNESR